MNLAQQSSGVQPSNEAKIVLYETTENERSGGIIGDISTEIQHVSTVQCGCDISVLSLKIYRACGAWFIY